MKSLLQDSPAFPILATGTAMNAFALLFVGLLLAGVAAKLALMRRHSITQLVVIDGEKYLGMVHLHDLIREGLV